MAGPVWNSKTNKPTGFGVALLVDYLLSLSQKAETPSSSSTDASSK